MTHFAARLRALSKAASPGPWFGGHLSETDDCCDCTYILNEHRCGSIATFSVAKEGDEYAAEYPTKAECIANMALTNTLRNHADRLADVVEAGRALVVRLDEMFAGPTTRAQVESLRAALDALASEADDAASGPKAPPRMEGDAP